MTVYVDDAFIPATVPNGGRKVKSRWCHLIADTEDELHEFAQRIGLRRSWFQVPKFAGKPCKPDSRAAQNWHYDVTESRRAAAVRLGAVEVTQREMKDIIDARYARLYPEAAEELEVRFAKIFEDFRIKKDLEDVL